MRDFSEALAKPNAILSRDMGYNSRVVERRGICDRWFALTGARKNLHLYAFLSFFRRMNIWRDRIVTVSQTSWYEVGHVVAKNAFDMLANMWRVFHASIFLRPKVFKITVPPICTTSSEMSPIASVKRGQCSERVSGGRAEETGTDNQSLVIKSSHSH